MSSKCSVLNDLANLSQTVASFLSSPGTLTPTDITNLVTVVQTAQGAVRDLPINITRKTDILNRLDQAIFILQNNVFLFNTPTKLLAVLEIFQLVSLKVQNLMLPCPQGIVTVTPSNKFSTLCQICN